MAKVIAILVLGLFALMNNVNATCLTCLANDIAACTDQTHFQYCIFGKLSDTIYACDEGQVCTAGGTCAAQTNGLPAPECGSDCNKCDAKQDKQKFACVSPTEYSPCDSSSAPLPVRFSCPNNKTCIIAKYKETDGTSVDQLCYNPCDAKPSCPVLTPEEQAAASCSGVLTKGAYPNKSDPTCKTYVYCELITGGSMYSQQFKCSDVNPYFDKATKQCVANKPSGCT